jgi:Ca-activated chloride channel family protein
MALIFWWMLLLWAIAIASYWVLAKRKRKPTKSVLPVAHTNRMTNLPEYAAALKRYRLLTVWVVGALTLSLLAAILLTARPSTVSPVTPMQQSRNIMLCLDASGSVLREDTTLLDRFSTLVSSFNGQRFGLTLFNSSAVTVIPLNDNYPLITEQLKNDAQAFKLQKGTTFTELTNGTLADFSSGTSLASDGLASCMGRMGPSTQHSPQDIILATDNEAYGTPDVSMNQDMALAKQLNIHVFTIDPGVSDPTLASDHGELKILAVQTDGVYYKLSDSGTVNSLIDTLGRQSPGSFVGASQLATYDDPKPFLYTAVLLTIASLVLLWRLEL